MSKKTDIKGVTLRGKNYKFGKFTALRLAPFAYFVSTGIKQDSDWGYAAKTLLKILPDLPSDLVSFSKDDSDILLNPDELATVYRAACDYLGISDNPDIDLEIPTDKGDIDAIASGELSEDDKSKLIEKYRSKLQELGV